MCKCHQPTEQCRFANEKINQKAIEEHGFATAKHETLHLSQWMQKKSQTASWDAILSPPWVQQKRWISMGYNI
jgi:hypothetical protein